MELKEIQSFLLTPAVSIPFAISWSEDNKISAVTEKGVYIVEVLPDPDNTQGLGLCRSWILPSDYLPTSYTKVNCDNLIWKLNQREVYEMVLDSCLAPNLQNTKSVPPYVTQATWSPIGMLYPSGCLLAVLTNYGSVVIQAPRGKQWQMLKNISAIWVEKCDAGWSPCDSSSSKEQFDILQSRANKLKTTSVIWSSFSAKKKACLLIMGMQNGTLLFWQLNAPRSTKDRNLEPNLLLEYATGHYHITAMHWVSKDENSGLLCVGDVHGIMKLYYLKWQAAELSCISATDLWSHKDHIQVTRFCAVSTNNSEITIVAAKGSFLIAIALDAECRVEKVKPFHVGNLSINGMVSLNNSNILVVTHSGSFKNICISRTDGDLMIKAQSLNSIVVPKSAYYGICASTNKGIFSLITSLNMMFDHLIQREPTQITFFKMCDMLDPYHILLSNPSEKLTKYWDYLEIIRLQGPPFPDVEKEQLELSSYHLKIRMWLCRFAVMQEDPEEDKERRNTIRERLQQAEHRLMIEHISKHVNKLTSQKSLTTQNRQSLALILSWLKKLEPDTRSTEVNEILRCLADIQDLPEHELCAVCQQECLPVENPVESRCVAGHMLPRCSVSMLQCSDLPFWICTVCHAVANLNSDVGDPGLCIFCDSQLQLTNNILLEGEQEEEDDEEEVIKQDQNVEVTKQDKKVEEPKQKEKEEESKQGEKMEEAKQDELEEVKQDKKVEEAK